VSIARARLSVRVHPGARHEALVGRRDNGEWKLAVSDPPEGGRANEAVVKLVASLLGLKPRQVSVARGLSSRAKQIEVEGLTLLEAERRLAALLAPTEDPDAE
jgi:uncharacterized protein YggU (UPF0235/DUF167 family)